MTWITRAEAALSWPNRCRYMLGTMAIVISTTCAAGSPYIPWRNKAAGETLAGTLESFQKLGSTKPELTTFLDSRRKSLAIVFVPGILGSRLVDKDDKTIYGDLSDPSTLLSRLELPVGLIDENAESGIRPSLLRRLGPMDLYGDAIDPIQEWASKNDVKFIACGYDWRRDIRSGARDLERCLNAELGSAYSDIVLVAHSMGGLVSWAWAMRHEDREFSPNRRLLQFTVLGSPLRGSCEIVRMVQSGYIQPRRRDSLQVRSDFKPLKYYLEKFVDAFTNGVSSQFTQGIRPLVLSWPGALELSPPSAASNGARSCVAIPASDDAPIGTPPTSYYDVSFWNSAAGRQMLRKGSGLESYATSSGLPQVLAKAREFRSTFSAKQLASPTWLYYSQLWFVPSEAGYRDPYISEADQWSTVWGDGRVPYVSAKNDSHDEVFAHMMAVESVHGNLPGDPNFFDDYFGSRLPMALAAIWATDAMKEALSKPEWIAGFAKLRAQGAEASQLRAALEPRGTESLLLKAALSTTAAFNDAVCSQRRCAETYAAARATIGRPTSRFGSLASLAQYSSATRTLDDAHRDFPFAEGNRGLVLAQRQDWAAAAISMQRALASLESRTENTPALTAAEVAFEDVLRRNLAKALVETGRCKAAEPLLRATTSSWSYAKDTLSKPCNDVESGLQYCFPTSGYCTSP